LDWALNQTILFVSNITKNIQIIEYDISAFECFNSLSGFVYYGCDERKRERGCVCVYVSKERKRDCELSKWTQYVNKEWWGWEIKDRYEKCD